MAGDVVAELKCSSCGAWKPSTEFYFRKTRGKLTARCKECIRSAVNAYRAANPEKVRESHRKIVKSDRQKATERKNYLRNKERVHAANRAARDKYPEKYKARTALAHALRAGRVVKPDCCEVCGKATRLDGHHADYSKPTEVRWVCRPCHGQEHKQMNEMMRQRIAA